MKCKNCNKNMKKWKARGVEYVQQSPDRIFPIEHWWICTCKKYWIMYAPSLKGLCNRKTDGMIEGGSAKMFDKLCRDKTSTLWSTHMRKDVE